MLAATRARPAATTGSPLVGYRRGLAAALASETGRTLADESLATTSDDLDGRLSCPLGSQLAAGRADLLTAISTDRDGDAGGSEASGEPLDHVRRAGLPGCVRDRGHRNEVHVGVV